MSLHRFLTRLIWLCVLPLMGLAAYLATEHVGTVQSARDLEALNLARNLATAIDHDLAARIGALNMLALSPLAKRPARWGAFYEEAGSFHESFGSHVFFADYEGRVVFDTTRPFGDGSQRLANASAIAAAMEGGAPVVGDLTAAGEVIIAVPGVLDDGAAFVVFTVLAADRLLQRLEQVALPAGPSLTLLDGKGRPIARRSPSEQADPVVDGGRFVARSTVSDWSVVMEIPPGLYRAPAVTAALAMGIALLGATMVGVLGGTLASRRLGRAVASLASAPEPGAEEPDIVEIAAARRMLDAAAERREHAEEALRELNAQLEQRVEARTAQLTAANRELDSFAYAVSHDLRAPLRAMSGFAQALREDYGSRLDDEGSAYLGQIELASRKMGELIDGILALSRSTRGELRREPVDVSAMAAALLAELARGEPERRVAVDIEPGLVVHASARMAEAVLQNLLGNAWKYTGHTAQPSIRVYAGELDGKPAVCVTDNGAGFDMAHARQLFEPFRRLHRQEEFPGLGIGLATVQRIIHRHGGDIRASAAPGEGATFCITFGEGEIAA